MARMNRARQPKNVSRQRRWQLRQIALGRCQRCGKRRKHYTTLCDPCGGTTLTEVRARIGAEDHGPTYLTGRKKHRNAGCDKRATR